LTFERLELPDGDFLELAWAPAVTGPCVIVLHGLEGNHTSTYVQALLPALALAGYRAVLMQFRDCGSEPNRHARSYHSGDTGDLAYVVDVLTARHGVPPFALVGYSLGGNVVLKWLAERGSTAAVRTAIAISVPFDLARCADRLNQGASRFYQRRLVTAMQTRYRRKFARMPSPLAIDDVGALDTFWRFDDAVTAPLHGFRDAVDYYALASCRPRLAAITRPTLILHALDDPFVPASAIPGAQELGAGTILELATHGGHVGFVAGPPWRPRYWLDWRILAHLAEVRAQSG
jgi:predicted alpha/beta-fold hydrolase